MTRKLGYRPDGERVIAFEGAPVRRVDFAMTVEQWRAVARPPVAIEGLEPCRPLLGAGLRRCYRACDDHAASPR